LTHKVVNGALTPGNTKASRQVIGDRVMLDVDPGMRAKTACFVRSGIKWPGGRKVHVFNGEIDGVVVTVCEKEGQVHVLMSKTKRLVP
jgi:hypothetical protein